MSKVAEDVLVALRRIIRAVDLHSRSLAQEYGLTVPQLLVLQEVSRLGEVSASEIARAVSLSQATLTGILGRLEKRGLITRRRSELDKRRLPVRTTAAGEGLLERAPPLLQESFTEEFNRLHDWEQTLILSSLRRLVAMMEARSVDASPILTTQSIDGGTPGEAEPPVAGGRQGH